MEITMERSYVGETIVSSDGLTLHCIERRGNTKLFMRDEDICAITDLENNILWEIGGCASQSQGYLSIDGVN